MYRDVPSEESAGSSVTRRGFVLTATAIAGGSTFVAPAAASHLDVNPSPPPDGTIEASSFEWLDAGAPQTGNDCALRVADDGGVDINFHVEIEGDLTIDLYWRHHAGGDLAYLWNDRNSTSTGFRAFTNGTADDGIYVRLPWAGDLEANLDLHDGEWHNVRLVVDADAITSTLFVDGDQQDQSVNRDPVTFTSGDDMRVMGRATGSSTEIDYDRYVWVPDAIYPDDEAFPTSDLLHYELDDCEGTTATNGYAATSGDDHECVPRRYRRRADAEADCDTVRDLGRGVGRRSPGRRGRGRSDGNR